jgi:hypothetical protein
MKYLILLVLLLITSCGTPEVNPEKDTTLEVLNNIDTVQIAVVDNKVYLLDSNQVVYDYYYSRKKYSSIESILTTILIVLIGTPFFCLLLSD